MFVCVLCCEPHSRMEQVFSREEFQQAMADTYSCAMKHERQNNIRLFCMHPEYSPMRTFVQAVTLIATKRV